MSEAVLTNILVEIIRRINEAQTAVKNATIVLPDLKDELDKIYDDLGEIAEKVVSILGR